ncbi:MAG: P-loop NTPase [Leptolyngbyaceae bacterium]|nr:P-loop NTPase [Leptolyngbyaceae bacterium]
MPSTPTDLNLNLGDLGNLGGNEGLVFSQQLDSRQVLASIVLSDDSLQQVLAIDPESDSFSRLSEYKDLFSVKTDTSSTVISLTSQASSPEIARQRLSNLINVFQKRLDDLRRTDASRRSQFIQQDLQEVEQNLATAEQALVSFQEKSNLIDGDIQTKELVISLNALRVSEAQLIAQLESSKAEVKALAKRLGKTPQQSVQILRLSDSPEYQGIQNKLSEVKVEMAAAQSQFADNHPQVQKLLAEQNELLQRQQEYIGQTPSITRARDRSIGQNYASLIERLILAETESQALQQQVAQLQTQIKQLNQQLRGIPSDQVRLADLKRKYNLAESVYNGLIAQVQASRVNAFSLYPNVQVLDQPLINPKAVGPGLKPIALGALLASLFGSAAIILFLDKRRPLLTQDDLDSTGLPVMGQIVHHRVHTKIDQALVTEFGFQHLASTVSMAPLVNRYLMISSATRGEGKTTVILGLANALLALGFRVLVVDADFYQSKLTKSLGYQRQEILEAGLQPLKVLPSLDLLAPQPKAQETMEFVAHGTLEQLLAVVQSKGQYDYILVDTPPIESANETVLMAQFLINVLLVVWPTVSDRSSFLESLEKLKQQQAKIWGLVINGIEGVKGDSQERPNEVKGE